MASSGNFSTWNSLLKPPSGLTLTQGNLKATLTSNNTGIMTNSQVPLTGKWYWEVDMDNIPSGQGVYIGVMPANTNLTINQESNNLGLVYYSINGNSILKGTRSSYGATYTTGDIISIAVDRDANTLQFYKNNSGQGTISISTLDEEFFCYMGCTGGSGPFRTILNFGQDSTFGGNETAGGNADENGFGDFKYAPPSGFLALCSANLPISDDIDPAQTDDNFPQKNFNVVTYDSTGSGQSITGVGFQPDLVWVKCRNVAQSNGLFDSNRGTSKVLNSDGTSAEATSSGLTSFDSDGYSMGTYYNQSGRQFVGWCWRANGGTTTSDSSGDITVTRQTNDAAKFSILTYTGNGSSGSTIAHGLGVKPAMTIIKQRNSSNGWNVWHQGNNNGDYDSFGELNGNASWYQNQGSNGPYTVAPGTDYLTLTAYGQVNGSSNTYVSYVWADVDGMQRFSNYTGNGNADGPFIYTGFRPRLLFIKGVDNASNWEVRDTARDTFNPLDTTILWDDSGAEVSSVSVYGVDILANGFKLRTTSANYNTSGNTYIYGAWGDVPFKYNNTF